MPRGRPRRRGRPGQDRDGDEAGDLATSPGSPARNARDRAGHPPSYGDVVTMLATRGLPISEVSWLLGRARGTAGHRFSRRGRHRGDAAGLHRVGPARRRPRAARPGQARSAAHRPHRPDLSADVGVEPHLLPSVTAPRTHPWRAAVVTPIPRTCSAPDRVLAVWSASGPEQPQLGVVDGGRAGA